MLVHLIWEELIFSNLLSNFFSVFPFSAKKVLVWFLIYDNSCKFFECNEILLNASVNALIVKTFRVMKNYKIDVRGEEIGLKIIPLDVDVIKIVLEKKKKYKELYSIFDDSYTSLQTGLNWYNNTLANKI